MLKKEIRLIKYIPENWNAYVLSALGEFKNGINKDKSSFGFGVPFVNLMDVFGKSSIANHSFSLVDASEKEQELYNLKAGDILFVRSSVKPEGVGQTCVVVESLKNTVYSGFLIRFRPDSKLINWKYATHCFDGSRFRQRLLVHSTIAANTNINQESLKQLAIQLPPLPEQKAIADLLSTWDEAIEKTEQLIVKKQKFYEAQLSKRLSLDIPERIKLKKFLKEVSKRNRDLSITQVLSVTNSKGFVRPEDQFDRQVASDNLSNYKIVSKGEYAYNPSRINVGSIARLDGWDVGVLSPMYTVFEIKKPSELHTDLFLHWLNSHEAKQRIRLSAQGSVRETVSFDDFCAIGFPKIDIKEQKALAEYFSLISAEIDTLKALSEKYKTQKRGLMQKMLTGIWRMPSVIIDQFSGINEGDSSNE